MEPGPPLSAAEQRRYARHLVLPEIGETGQRRLRSARVLVVGAGGLGAPVLSYLAAAGVGRLGVVDDDVVTESNLQRQLLHGTSDVGRAKTASAAASVRETNPLVEVVEHRVRLREVADAAALLEGYDLVVDGADNFATRYLLADAGEQTRTPEVWGSVLRWDGQVSTFWPGRGPLYRDLFPVAPPQGSVASCAQAGVLGAVCGAVGTVMAAEVVKLLTGAGRTLVGRVLVLDGLAGSWREVPVRAGARRAGATGPVTRRDRPDQADPADQADQAAPGPVVPEVTAGDLDGLAASGALVLDVRGDLERGAVELPGSVHVPFHELVAGAPGEPPIALREGGALARADRSAPVVVCCAVGVRSLLAAETLLAEGFTAVLHLEGGVTAWLEQR